MSVRDYRDDVMLFNRVCKAPNTTGVKSERVQTMISLQSATLETITL